MPIPQQQSGNRILDGLQREVRTELSRLKTSGLSANNILEGVSIAPGGTSIPIPFPGYRGWIVVTVNVSATIWEVSRSSTTLVLDASTACTVDLLVV